MPKRSKKKTTTEPQETVAGSEPPQAVNGAPSVPHETVEVVRTAMPGEGETPDYPWLLCTHETQSDFIVAFLSCGDIKQAASDVGICRRTHYAWMARDKKYAEIFESVRKYAGNILEDSLLDRAINGWLEPVFGGVGDGMTGEVGERRKFDNAMAMKMLERLKPSKTIVEPSQQDGLQGNVFNVFSQHTTIGTDERRASLLTLIGDEMRRRGIGGNPNGNNGGPTNGNGKH